MDTLDAAIPPSGEILPALTRAMQQPLRDPVQLYIDGLAVMQEHAGRGDYITFIDPPYTAGGKKAGSRL